MEDENLQPEQTGQPGDTDAQPAAAQPPAGQQEGVPLSDSHTLNQGDTGQPAPGQDQGIMIPKERLDQISAENQELKNQLQQLQYMQAMSMQQPAQTLNGTPYDDLDDDDYVSVAKAKKDRELLIQTVAQQARTEARSAVFHAQHSDFSEVVGTRDYTGNFQASPYLLEALNQNPAERMYLQTLDQASQEERAYMLAMKVKNSKAPPPPAVPNTPGNTRQYNLNTANANLAPLPASSAGGGGAIDPQVQMSGMSESEFSDYDRRVEAGEFDP